MAEKDHKDKSQKAQSGNLPVFVEWVIAGISALLLVLIVIFLVYDAFTRIKGKPDLSAEVGAITRVSHGYMAEINIRNDGDGTAAAVDVEGVLTLPDGSEETSTATLDYAPSLSTRKIMLMFTTDPAAGELIVRPTGFSKP